MPGGRLPVPLVLALLLAGCAGKAPGPSNSSLAPAPPAASFSDETCGLEGVIQDDEVVPVPNARVAFANLDLATTSDELGRFAFGDVPLGRHSLYADAAGHERATRTVDCVPGQVLRADLVLVALPDDAVPFQMLYEGSGRIGCSFAFWLNAPDMCQPGWANQSNPGVDPTAKSRFRVQPYAGARNVTGAAFEVRWQPSGPVGGKFLKLVFPLAELAPHPFDKTFCPTTRNISINGYNAVRGPSILCVRIAPAMANQTVYLPRADGTWAPLEFSVEPAHNTQEFLMDPFNTPDESSKLVVGQNFDWRFTLFYNGATVPPDYLAFEE